MSDGKLNEEQRYKQLQNETNIVGKAHDLLMTGRFPGGAAQDLAVCQMYLQGLYTHLKAEVDKLAPLPLPVDNKPLELKAEALPADSSKAL